MAATGGARARAPAWQPRARPRERHGRPVRRPRQCRPPADLGRPQLRDARRRPLGRTAGAGRHPAPAGARPCGRRRDVRVRAAQPRRAPGVLRRARTRRATGRADRAARRRDPAQPARPLGQRHLLRQGRAPDRRAAVRRRGLPLPPQERRLPSSPDDDGRAAARRRVRRRVAPPALGWDHPAADRHTRADRCGPSPDLSRATSISTTSPVATASCSSATASASPAAASRRACPFGDAADVLAAIEHDDDDAGDAPAGRSRSASLPFLPGRPAELVVPAPSCRKRADGPGVGHR